MAPSQCPSSSPAVSSDDFSFEIRQYLPEDHDEVLSVVGNGFRSYGPVGHPLHDFWANYAQNSLTDLRDISGHYMGPGSNFFVVTATANGENKPKPIVVATAGVDRKSDSVVELRRVSVKLEFQRFGLGRMLMNHVHQWAKEHWYEKMLGCTASKRAVKFYDSLGYTFTHVSVWNADPLIEVDDFEKLL